MKEQETIEQWKKSISFYTRSPRNSSFKSKILSLIYLAGAMGLVYLLSQSF